MERIHCPKCNYSWDTSSTKIYITCPNCLSKIKREENKVKDE